ncbi:MAG: hypothetical protein IPK75_16265 [Acidobacteria bacterium]|nr:hypothetical protein [Acidobacteriota bacterium]
MLHQLLHLERGDGGEGEIFFVSVEEVPVRARQCERMQRGLQRLILQQEDEARQCTFGLRRRGKRREPLPETRLELRRKVDALAGNQACQPVRRKARLCWLVDIFQRLEPGAPGAAGIEMETAC